MKKYFLTNPDECYAKVEVENNTVIISYGVKGTETIITDTGDGYLIKEKYSDEKTVETLLNYSIVSDLVAALKILNCSKKECNELSYWSVFEINKL